VSEKSVQEFADGWFHVLKMLARYVVQGATND
jgi:hypothetical protein